MTDHRFTVPAVSKALRQMGFTVTGEYPWTETRDGEVYLGDQMEVTVGASYLYLRAPASRMSKRFADIPALLDFLVTLPVLKQQGKRGYARATRINPQEGAWYVRAWLKKGERWFSKVVREGEEVPCFHCAAHMAPCAVTYGGNLDAICEACCCNFNPADHEG